VGKILIGRTSEVAPGRIRKFTLPNSVEIAVANVNGKYYAVQNHCGHQGGPLGEGGMEGNVVTCPWHGARWDVTNGKLVEFPLDLEPIRSYAVIVEGDSLFIDL
jgi:nitrite reductase/ring-hydroxylating ferredoxin subunit